MDRQTDGQMFGHFSANRQMDRQTDGQTEFANFNIDWHSQLHSHDTSLFLAPQKLVEKL